MKTLLMMRHGKSDWNADFGSDHDRPLNERGVRNSRLMGQVLAVKGLEPDFVLSSTAVRARTTAELASEAGKWRADIRLDRALYDSGPDGVLASAAEVPEVTTLMLVGHQPTWSMLVRGITGEPVDLRTATVAVIEVDLDSWANLPGASGRLLEVLSPRAFGD
jgi:phosphohistidine phosphatase